MTETATVAGGQSEGVLADDRADGRGRLPRGLADAMTGGMGAMVGVGSTMAAAQGAPWWAVVAGLVLSSGTAGLGLAGRAADVAERLTRVVQVRRRSKVDHECERAILEAIKDVAWRLQERGESPVVRARLIQDLVRLRKLLRHT